MYYSYARVSTTKQDLLRQEVAIKEFVSSHNITLAHEFSDKVSGTTFNRNEYIAMKACLKSGDTVIIKELDRLGRDWDGIKDEWKYFVDNDINVIVIDMPLLAQSIYDSDGKVDLNIKFVKTIVFETLCYVSENERQKISRRTKESLAAIKAQGIVLGKPIDKAKEQNIRELFEEGRSKSEIAYIMDTSRAQVDKVLKRIGLIKP